MIVVSETGATGSGAVVALVSRPLAAKGGVAPALSEPLIGAEEGLVSPIGSTGMLTITACSCLPDLKPVLKTLRAELPSSDRVEHRESVRCTSF